VAILIVLLNKTVALNKVMLPEYGSQKTPETFLILEKQATVLNLRKEKAKMVGYTSPRFRPMFGRK
jgi:hypothetical protein